MGIKKRGDWLAFCGGSSTGLAVILSATSLFGANADLSGWVGTNNTTGGNNYSVMGPSSAGGSFIDRPANVSSLVDITLVDPTDPSGSTPLIVKWNSEVTMSGTIQFSGAALADPTLFLGWYNSADTSAPNGTTHYKRLGIGFADPSPASDTGLRVMIQTSSTATTVASTGIFGGGTAATKNTASTLAAGTYDFTFNYDGDGRITGTFGGMSFGDVPGGPNARTWPFPLVDGNNQDLDTFGFLQNSATGGSPKITVNVSKLSYTGQTDATGGGVVAGDYNHNGVVDAADYVVWRDGNLAADGTGPGGTPDGVVNGLDFDFWRAHFGNTSGSGRALGAGTAVPEPTTLAFAFVSLGINLVVRVRVDAKR